MSGLELDMIWHFFFFCFFDPIYSEFGHLNQQGASLILVVYKYYSFNIILLSSYFSCKYDFHNYYSPITSIILNSVL